MSQRSLRHIRTFNQSRRAARREQLLAAKKELQALDNAGISLSGTPVTLPLGSELVNNDNKFFVLGADSIEVSRDCSLDAAMTVTIEGETAGEFEAWIEVNGAAIEGSRMNLQLLGA